MTHLYTNLGNVTVFQFSLFILVKGYLFDEAIKVTELLKLELKYPITFRAA